MYKRQAFGYYDYGQETGMSAAFSGKDATANYICAYVRGVLPVSYTHLDVYKRQAAHIEATDASPEMITEAKRGNYSAKLRFLR